MSSTYTQDGRPMALTTPLGKDKLLLIGLSGREAISQIYSFHLQALAAKPDTVSFAQLFGKKVTVTIDLPAGKKRYFNGIVIRAGEGVRDLHFTEYSLEIVPTLWLLTRKAKSKIFQRMSVPDILKVLFAGMNVAFQLQGTFEPRDYCTQYRETDFNFASRLMEEEGIYYFFEHTASDHQMVVANTPSSHADVPGPSALIFEGMEGGVRDEDRVHTWVKTQEMKSGKYVLWDYTFEVPKNHLEAPKQILDDVQVGTVSHSLKVGGNDAFEIYDFPGVYANRFDGISVGGGEQPSEIGKIFTDNARTVGIRMEEEASLSILIQGGSSCRQLASGHKFSLQRHFNADGSYVLASVAHFASLAAYRTHDDSFSYSNTFSCFPVALPFRPSRLTPKPTGLSTQTAVVVGPSGQEIFTDKYGRVKVQFHWDREGKNDSDSSCWVRVLQPTAGSRWGSSFWPRIGQEVVVDFEEGDPDAPIIIGCVYNASQMPPYLGDGPDSKHTNDNKVSGFKTCSTMGGSGYNELRFDDTKGTEEIYIHAERNLDIRVEEDTKETVGSNRHLIVGSPDTKWDKTGDQMAEIYHNNHIKVHNNQEEEIDGTLKLHIKGDVDVLMDADHKKTVGGDDHLHVKGARLQKIDGKTSLTVGGAQHEKIGDDYLLEAGGTIHLKAATDITLECVGNLTIKVGSNFLSISDAGVTIVGEMVLINSGGAAGSGIASSPDAPTDAAAAAPVAPTAADTSVPGAVSSSQ